jgi:hypothetical protein
VQGVIAGLKSRANDGSRGVRKLMEVHHSSDKTN